MVRRKRWAPQGRDYSYIHLQFVWLNGGKQKENIVDKSVYNCILDG